MRLYVCVTSYHPLTAPSSAPLSLCQCATARYAWAARMPQVYMHRGGFCRFSMSRYSSDKSNLNDLGSHLTNVAAGISAKQVGAKKKRSHGTAAGSEAQRQGCLQEDRSQMGRE